MTKQETTTIEQVIERGFGIDVHKEMLIVTIMGKGIKTQTRQFKTFTEDLEACRRWIESQGIKQGAMESTGVYWKPVFNILSESLAIKLVNARHIKNVPGRKTDVKDSEWICKLLLSGLLNGSFVPPELTRETRDIFRYKVKMTQAMASEKNRIQRILEDANIKLSSVVSDMSGVTAIKLIDGIIAGRTDINELVEENYHGKLSASKGDLKKAMTGRLTDHHKYMLLEIKDHIKYLEDKIENLEKKLEEKLAAYQTEIELLDTIPGVDKQAAIGIISEIGTDMSAFADEQKFASWAGMCPGNNESAGKKKSSRITHGNKTLKALLVQIAWAATRTKGTYLRAKYDSLVGRRGKKRALIAVGHKILCSIYHILKNKEAYKELGSTFLEEKKIKNKLKNINQQLNDLGYEQVVLKKVS
jgi:transposase